MRHIRHTIIAATILGGLALSAAPSAAATTSELSQFGITWTFAEPVEYGQFANGDYWVVGPIEITHIDPPSAEISGRTKNGSMINPGLGMTQGYDSAMYGPYGPAYSADLNVALGVSAASPLEVPAGSSLISSISIDEAGHRPQLATAAVLTVLAESAPDGSFRPPYFGDAKTIEHNAADLDFSKLPRLAPVDSTPDLAQVAARFQKPWLEHVLSWTGRYCHPANNMPDYGRDIALAIGNATLSLLLDHTDDEKRTLLVRLVQYGIDLYAIADAGGVWEDLGGHMHGRKLPILLAGLVLDDADMLGVGQTMPARFQEDRQTWIVTEADVGRPLYHADGRPREEYIEADVGVPEWGEQHTRQPQRDGRNWDAYYRRIVGHSILAHVLTANVLGLRDEWDWEPLFLYIDRYWEIEKDVTSSGGGNIPTFHKNMWLAYRDTVHEPVPQFQVTGWAVEADHGPAGTVATGVTDGYVESRRGAVARLLVTCSSDVAEANPGVEAVTIVGQAGGDVSSLVEAVSVGGSASQLVIDLSAPLPDGDTYTVTLSDSVTSAAGEALTGDTDLEICVRAGDVNGSGVVDEADVEALRPHVGEDLGPANARFDVDRSGAITGGDMMAVKHAAGQ